MPGTTDLEGLYTVFEEAARQLDLACSRDVVWPVLTTYEDVIPRSLIALRVETSARRGGDLSCRFTMIPKEVDIYALAVDNGLTPRTDHPVAALTDAIAERFPIDNHGVDFGVVGGFTKSFQFFPPTNLQLLSALTDIPSAPPGLAENSEFFAKHGVADQLALTGINYESKTVNCYFKTADGYLEPKNIATILADLGLPEPSDLLLKVAQAASGFYVTLSYDSPQIQRICFSAMTLDPVSLLGGVDPRIDGLIEHGPSADPTGVRRSICYAASSPAGEYNKLCTFYRAQPIEQFWNQYSEK